MWNTTCKCFLVRPGDKLTDIEYGTVVVKSLLYEVNANGDVCPMRTVVWFLCAGVLTTGHIGPLRMESLCYQCSCSNKTRLYEWKNGFMSIIRGKRTP